MLLVACLLMSSALSEGNDTDSQIMILIQLSVSSVVYPITLPGCWGTTDDFTTISFHLVLSSAALVELAMDFCIIWSGNIKFNRCIIDRHIIKTAPSSVIWSVCHSICILMCNCITISNNSILGQFQHGCHLSSTSKFPGLSLTFCSFPYPLTDKKNQFIL